MSAESPSNPLSTEAAHRLNRLLGYLKQDAANISLRSQAIAAAFAVGAWDQARQLIQEGLAQMPGAAELQAHAGFLALREQHYEQAKEHFSAAIAQGMDAAGVRYNLAFAHFQLAEYSSALASLEGLSNTADIAKAVSLLRARCFHHLERRDEAIAALLSLAHRDDEAEGLLALLLHEADRGEEALQAANRVLANKPDQLEALLARAATLVELEQHDAARKDYEAATKAHPHCGRAWSGLAQLDFYEFDFDNALAALQKAVTHMPNHIGTWHLLAWLHVVQGQVPAAKQAFQKAFELDRNFGESHGGLAVIAALEDQPKLADEYIKRATRLNPHGFAAQYAKMVLLEKQGHETEAKELLNSVMRTNNPGIGIAPEVLVNRRLAQLGKPSGKLH